MTYSAQERLEDRIGGNVIRYAGLGGIVLSTIAISLGQSFMEIGEMKEWYDYPLEYGTAGIGAVAYGGGHVGYIVSAIAIQYGLRIRDDSLNGKDPIPASAYVLKEAPKIVHEAVAELKKSVPELQAKPEPEKSPEPVEKPADQSAESNKGDVQATEASKDPQGKKSEPNFLNRMINKLAPGMDEYVPPESEVKGPSIWEMSREPIARVLEALQRMSPWLAVPLCVVFIGLLNVTPLVQFFTAPFFLVGLLALYAKGARIQHLDRFAYHVDKVFSAAYRWTGAKLLVENVVRPAARVVTPVLATVAEKTGIAWLYRGFASDPLGGMIDKVRGGRTKKERTENKIKERTESGEPYLGALAVANEAIDNIVGPDLGLTLDEVRGCIPKSYKQDLLNAFDLPTSEVDLVGLAKHVAAGRAYQNLKYVLRTKGYDCRIVQCEHTIVLEIWKPGVSEPQHLEGVRDLDTEDIK